MGIREAFRGITQQALVFIYKREKEREERVERSGFVWIALLYHLLCVFILQENGRKFLNTP